MKINAAVLEEFNPKYLENNTKDIVRILKVEHNKSQYNYYILSFKLKSLPILIANYAFILKFQVFKFFLW